MNKSPHLGADAKTTSHRWAKWEAFFFNHGPNIVYLALLLALDICMAAWGAWQFTKPQFETPSDILRITLPIARASGRLVTWNSALITLSGCKFFWTQLRKTPLAQGFPIDKVMPYYHRIVAQTIIFMGCIIHSAPQIVNYATGALEIEFKEFWTLGNGLATGQLLVTGVLLLFIFALFFVTTLEKIRRTTFGFRVFWACHLFGIIAGIPLLIIHGTYLGVPILLYFVALPLILYVLDSFFRRVKVAKYKAEVVHLETHKDGEKDLVVQIVVYNPKFVYQPGQYAEINIPEISKSEWHPFTIASAPSNGKDSKEYGQVEFFVKSSGKWTSALYELASRNPNNQYSNGTKIIAEVGLRGPFGAPAQNYNDFDHLVVIGSGIGVTPLLSIWKHVVNEAPKLDPELAKGQRNSIYDRSGDSAIRSSRRTLSNREMEERLLNSFVEHPGHVDVATFEGVSLETLRARAAYGASVLESMTVNVALFCFSIFVETVGVVLYLFHILPDPFVVEPSDSSPGEMKVSGAAVQIVVSSLVLSIIGGKVVLSLVAYRQRYLCSFVCLLEMGLVISDALALSFAATSIAAKEVQDAFRHFALFGCYLVLHLLRMMYIFYASAQPPSVSERTQKKNCKENNGIKSVVGIWVSRKYSGMSFAAHDLVESVQNLPSTFSLKLYATRDSDEAVQEADPFKGRGSQHALIAGRPDWEQILSEALDRCYDDGGDAVGVFFCGSPAISSSLHRIAQKVNAEHYYATGGRSQCRILVHKENF